MSWHDDTWMDKSLDISHYCLYKKSTQLDLGVISVKNISFGVNFLKFFKKVYF